MKHSFINNAEFNSILGTSLDFSQYIALLNRKEIEKNKGSFKIGEIESSKGYTLNISICGIPIVTNHKGENIGTGIEYAEYVNCKTENELNHENISYIEISGLISKDRKFMGIFYSLNDVIDYFQKIEKGETEYSEMELVSA